MSRPLSRQIALTALAGLAALLLVLGPGLIGGHWDRVVGGPGPPPVPYAVVTVVSVVAVAIATILVVRSRPSDPAFPPSYAPPAGIGPAQGGFALERAVSARLYAATLLAIGEHGLATISREENGWTITGADGDWSQVDRVTRRVAYEFGIDRPGGRFVADVSDRRSRALLESARGRLDDWLNAWAEKEGLFLDRTDVLLGQFAAAALGTVGFLLVTSNPLSMTLAAVPLLAYAVAAVPLTTPGRSRRWTARGRDLAVGVGGFRRVVATASAQARFDFSRREMVYVSYLPWAVALGVARDWERLYRAQVGLQPPSPRYANQPLDLDDVARLVLLFRQSMPVRALRRLLRRRR